MNANGTRRAGTHHTAAVKTTDCSLATHIGARHRLLPPPHSQPRALRHTSLHCSPSHRVDPPAPAPVSPHIPPTCELAPHPPIDQATRSPPHPERMPPKKNKKKAKAPSPPPDLNGAPFAAAPAAQVEAEQPAAGKVTASPLQHPGADPDPSPRLILEAGVRTPPAPVTMAEGRHSQRCGAGSGRA